MVVVLEPKRKNSVAYKRLKARKYAGKKPGGRRNMFIRSVPGKKERGSYCYRKPMKKVIGRGILLLGGDEGKGGKRDSLLRLGSTTTSREM